MDLFLKNLKHLYFSEVDMFISRIIEGLIKNSLKILAIWLSCEGENIDFVISLE